MLSKTKQSQVGRRFISVNEAAEYLKLDPVTVRRMLAADQLPSVRLPGRGQRRVVRIDLRALDAQLEKSARPTR